MGNALASSVLSVSRSEWPMSVSTPVISSTRTTETPSAIPEPPSLGTLPKGPKARVLALSMAAYGGLLAGALVFAMAAPPKAAPLRVVTVALEAFDVPSAPPPPPAAAGGATETRTASAVQSEAPATIRTPEVSRPNLDAPVVSALPSQVSGQASGTPGGQAGGETGGVLGGQAGGVVGAPSSAVVPPRFDAAYLQNPEPGYPLLSKRLGEEGRVILRVLVNPEGLAEQVEVRQSSGHSRLDQAALGTVRRWRFTPARRGAERLAAWVLVPLSFQLDA